MSSALSGWLLAIGGAFAAIGWILFALLDPEHERRSDPTWLGFNLPIILLRSGSCSLSWSPSPCPRLLLGGLGFGVVLLADSPLPAWIGVVVIAGVVAGVATNFIKTSDAVSSGWVPALGSVSLAVVGAARLLSL